MNSRAIILSAILVLAIKVSAQEYDRTIKQYIIAELSPLENSIDKTELGNIQQQHMAYIKKLTADDNLVLAGPYTTGGGLFFLNTSDEAVARAWIENDPSVKSKASSYTLKKWFTEKGLFTLDNEVPDNKFGKLNPNAPEETIQYGQFVGEWDIDVSNLTREGNWVEDKASWTFKYVMGGYAVQDFWTRLKTPNEKDGEDYFGSNIRIYNPEVKKWKTVWLESGSNNMRGIWTSYENEKGEIILHDDSKKWEIRFFNINDSSFDWKWDFKLDDGSMQTRVKIKAKRIF